MLTTIAQVPNANCMKYIFSHCVFLVLIDNHNPYKDICFQDGIHDLLILLS